MFVQYYSFTLLFCECLKTAKTTYNTHNYEFLGLAVIAAYKSMNYCRMVECESPIKLVNPI